jgi:DNA repair protein RAD57
MEQRQAPPQFASLPPVGDGVYLYESTKSSQHTDSEPSLVVLCTWLGGATSRNVSKYVAGYRQLFPSSAILLVTARLSEITVTPFSFMHARLKPARNIILRYVAAGYDRPCILWHIFSNGGLNTAIQLALMVKKRYKVIAMDEDSTVLEMNTTTSKELFLDSALGGVILDCCPGDDTFDKTYKAAAVSLPKTQPARALGTAVLYPTIRVLLKIQNDGYMSSLGDLARGANDRRIFGTAVRRLYLYSEHDDLIDWHFVENHLTLANEKGFNVRSVMIPGGSHCALIRGDAVKYWKSIERFWEGTGTDFLAVPSRL